MTNFLKAIGCLGLILAVGLLINVPFASAATRHTKGSVVVDSKHTVFFLGTDQRYPFPSMAIFKSWGHKASDINKANSEDLALPIGPTVSINQLPVGFTDTIDENGVIHGWALDKDSLDSSLLVWAFFDAKRGDSNAAGSAYISRPDVNSALGVTGNHGFEVIIPDNLRDGLEHTAYMYANDINDDTGNTFVELARSPIKFTLAPLTAPQILQFDVTPQSITAIDPNEKYGPTLLWQVIPQSSVVNITPEIKDVPNPVGSGGGAADVIDKTTTYTLTATFNGQSVSQSATVEFVNNSQPSISYFDAYSAKIKPGDTTTLEWSTSDATTVTLDNSPVDLTGSKDVTPTATTTYTLAATSASGTVSEQVTITILTPAELRDAQRLIDLGTIFGGLGIYSENNSKKFPVTLQSLVPNYMDAVPTPVASSASPCSGSDNNYVYTVSADLTNFTLKYCLEVDHTDLSSNPLLTAGVHTYDYAEILKKSQGVADDARRMADVHQLMTGLELFYNDNNRYPASLNGTANPNDGNPKWSTYISTWPTAPVPAGGTCTQAQNTYTYQQLNSGQSYQLTFCLSADIAGYTAGVKTASPSGIN
ncbi:MAG: hypothetical protein WDN47_01870 [Candidatus Doudnabacteria bacterium]